MLWWREHNAVRNQAILVRRHVVSQVSVARVISWVRQIYPYLGADLLRPVRTELSVHRCRSRRGRRPPVRALTIQQPFAHCVAIGVKTVENRSWSTSYRGPVAIHAGRQWARLDPIPHHLTSLFEEHLPSTDHESVLCRLAAGQNPHGLVFGAVIAVVDLISCHRAADCCWPWGGEPGVDERPGWHWMFTDAHRLPQPIPAVGKQGLWEVSDLGVASC